MDPLGLCKINGNEYLDGGSACPDITSITVSGGLDLAMIHFFMGLFGASPQRVRPNSEAKWDAPFQRPNPLMDARSATTAAMRTQSTSAVNALHANCRNIFQSLNPDSPVTIGPTRTVLDGLHSAALSVFFYDARGPESGMMFSVATGYAVTSDSTVLTVSETWFSQGAAAVTLRINDIAIPHVILGAEFFETDAVGQSSLLVHELLHVVYADLDHDRLAKRLNIPSVFSRQG
jgi:hypothetical protein